MAKAFEKAFRGWPTSLTNSRPAAEKAWAGLSPDQREAAHAAIARYVAVSRSVGRTTVCSFGVYLAERRWEHLPDAPESEARPEVAVAPPFGPAWMAMVLSALMTEAPRPGPPPPAFLRQLLAQDDAAGEAARLERQASHGWPRVNFMFDQAERRRGVPVRGGAEALKAAMEPVPVDGAVFCAWRDEFARRGWPWLPDHGGMGVVYFPAGGPDGLSRFAALAGQAGEGDGQGAGAGSEARDEEHDAGRSQRVG